MKRLGQYSTPPSPSAPTPAPDMPEKHTGVWIALGIMGLILAMSAEKHYDDEDEGFDWDLGGQIFEDERRP